MTREQEERMYSLLTMQSRGGITGEEQQELTQLIDLDNVPEVDDEPDEDEEA